MTTAQTPSTLGTPAISLILIEVGFAAAAACVELPANTLSDAEYAAVRAAPCHLYPKKHHDLIALLFEGKAALLRDLNLFQKQSVYQKTAAVKPQQPEVYVFVFNNPVKPG